MSPASSLRLRDGRTLGYAEYGDPAGFPVVFFHGIPGSRLQRHPDDTIAARLGIRLITMDRPGIGLSTFHHGRRLLDCAADVRELAAALGLRRFAVLGWSGGGPYAAACAYGLAERVTTAGLLGTLGPMDTPGALAAMTPRNRLGFGAARRLPWPLLRWIWGRELGAAGRDPQGWYERWLATIPDADRTVARQHPEIVRLLADAVPVIIWHGDADTLAPPAMAEALARRIPRARLTVYRGEGHWLLFPRWAEVLGALAPAPRRGTV
ncbi:MAG TPA: alpha/beta fold hydrolase [bacterium]|nr:alpha/beta fold hydrolase [bacterium]